MIIPEPSDRTIQETGAEDFDMSSEQITPRPSEIWCIAYDYIDETIEESMIASDSPSHIPETTIGPPGRWSFDSERGD